MQLYVKDLEASCAVPLHGLRGFARVRLGPGEAHTVSFDLAPRDLMMVNDAAGACSSPAASAPPSAAASPTRAAWS